MLKKIAGFFLDYNWFSCVNYSAYSWFVANFCRNRTFRNPYFVLEQDKISVFEVANLAT